MDIRISVISYSSPKIDIRISVYPHRYPDLYSQIRPLPLNMTESTKPHAPGKFSNLPNKNGDINEEVQDYFIQHKRINTI